VASFLDGPEPRLEVAWCTTYMDPLVSDVLGREDVVVVAHWLESDDATDGTVGQVLGQDGHCPLLHVHLLLLGGFPSRRHKRRLPRRRHGEPTQWAGEDKERQRYRTRLDAEAGGATKEFESRRSGVACSSRAYIAG